MKLVGFLLIVAGLIGLLCAISYDTSVPLAIHIGDVDRVHNIGLLDQRRTILIVSALGLILGTITMCAGFIRDKDRHKETKGLKPKPSEFYPPDNLDTDPNGWQDQQVEINPQQAEWAAQAGKRV